MVQQATQNSNQQGQSDLNGGAVAIDATELSPQEIGELLSDAREMVSRLESLLGLKDDGEVVTYDERGVPYLKPGTEVTMISITDCHDTETYARMMARFAGNMPANMIFSGHTLPVDNFATLHLGSTVASFVGERLSLDSEKQTPVILLGNAAPRPGNDPNSVGTRFVLAQLPGNIFYLGTLDGALSLVKDTIIDQKLFELNIEHVNAATVFRSRFLPETAVAWISGARDAVKHEIDIDLIRPLEDQNVILSVDNFGNIKTALTKSDLEEKGIKIGDMLHVSIGSRTLMVKYGLGLGDVEEKELVLAQGSSNHGISGTPKNLLDIYCNNLNAARQFGLESIPNSPVGTKVEIRKA